MQRKIRPAVIGKDGIGKSAFAATFPKPMYVFLFDPPDKAQEYLRRGEAGDIQAGKYGYFQEVHSTKTGDRIIHLEYWGEVNPNEARTYGRFVSRTANLERELVEQKVETAIFDSATHFELMVRFYSESYFQPSVKEPRLHYGYSAHAIEQYVMTRWPNLIMCNAVMVGHPGDYEKEEVDKGSGEITRVVRTIDVPGKIGSKIGTAFTEVWRVYMNEENERRLQTGARPGLPYACKTAIGIKDGIPAHYEALFEKEEKEKVEHV